MKIKTALIALVLIGTSATCFAKEFKPIPPKLAIGTTCKAASAILPLACSIHTTLNIMTKKIQVDGTSPTTRIIDESLAPVIVARRQPPS